MSAEEYAGTIFTKLYKNVPEFQEIVNAKMQDGCGIFVYFTNEGIEVNVWIETDKEQITKTVNKYTQEGKQDTPGIVYVLLGNNNTKILAQVLPAPEYISGKIEEVIEKIIEKMEKIGKKDKENETKT